MNILFNFLTSLVTNKWQLFNLDYPDHFHLHHGPSVSIFQTTRLPVTISIFFKLFQPSIDCSPSNITIFKVFERVCFSFTWIKFIKLNNCNFKTLFTIAIHVDFAIHGLTILLFFENFQFDKNNTSLTILRYFLNQVR